MNQRDQNQGGRRGERLQQGGYRTPEDEGREDEGRGRTWRERVSAGFRDTYNPEPQWLREDRESRTSRGHEERDEWGRGSYAATGREWGEPARGSQGEFGQRYGSSASGRESSGYDNAYGGSRRDVEDYGAADERGWSEREAHRGYSAGAGRNRPLSERERQLEREREREREVRGAYGMHSREMPYRSAHDLSTGFEPSRWEDDDFSGAYGRYGAFRVGTGMGLASTDYGRPTFGGSYGASSGYGSARLGSRAGWDLGTHQRDTGPSFRGLGPQNYKRPDERIRDDVYERLTDSHIIDARNIMVDVNQGNVTLTGTVTERRMRYAAEDLVESVMGVANINNQLKVQNEQISPSGTTGTQATGESQEPKRH